MNHLNDQLLNGVIRADGSDCKIGEGSDSTAPLFELDCVGDMTVKESGSKLVTVNRLEPQSGAITTSAKGFHARQSCKFFAAGTCAEGTRCKFLHGSIHDPTSTAIACQYFTRGNCREGDHCRFSHLGTNQAPPRVNHLPLCKYDISSCRFKF